MRFLWIGLFGLAGIFCRYGVDSALTRPGVSFPLGTFAINIAGSFLAGALYAWGVERGMLGPDLRIGVFVGFLGGFTTFSSYALQSATLLESGKIAMAVAYLGLSPVLGLGAAVAGLRLARGWLF